MPSALEDDSTDDHGVLQDFCLLREHVSQIISSAIWTEMSSINAYIRFCLGIRSFSGAYTRALPPPGPQVTKVRVTKLVSNTYHARVHYAPAPGERPAGFPGEELDVDARPSDAINLAVRFNAPIFICKQVCLLADC